MKMKQYSNALNYFINVSIRRIWTVYIDNISGNDDRHINIYNNKNRSKFVAINNDDLHENNEWRSNSDGFKFNIISKNKNYNNTFTNSQSRNKWWEYIFYYVQFLIFI